MIHTTVIATITNEGNATAKDFNVSLGHSLQYNVWWNFGTGQAILDDRVIPLKEGGFTFTNLFPAERGYVEFNVEIDPILYDQVTKKGDIPLMFFEVTYSELDEPQKFEYCVEIPDYRCPRLT